MSIEQAELIVAALTSNRVPADRLARAMTILEADLSDPRPARFQRIHQPRFFTPSRKITKLDFVGGTQPT